MLFDPYKTAVGLYTSNNKLSVTLAKFITLHQDITKLSYEFRSPSEAKLVFITGCNDIERDLPVWNHPMVITMPNNDNYVVIDMRPYVRVPNEDMVDISSYATIGGGFTYNIVRALYTAVVTKGKHDNDGMRPAEISAVEKTVSMGFMRWFVNSIVTSINLGSERAILQIVVLHYILSIMYDQDVTADNADVIYFKIARYLPGANNNVAVVKKTLENVAVLNPRDAVDLCDNIKAVMPNTRITDINTKVIYSVIGGTWKGPNPSESIAMAFEHIPTLISILYSAADPKGFKFSKLTTYLKDNSRENGINDFLKTVDIFVKEHTMLA